jgi:hypothetical protein
VAVQIKAFMGVTDPPSSTFLNSILLGRVKIAHTYRQGSISKVEMTSWSLSEYSTMEASSTEIRWVETKEVKMPTRMPAADIVSG